MEQPGMVIDPIARYRREKARRGMAEPTSDEVMCLVFGREGLALLKDIAHPESAPHDCSDVMPAVIVTQERAAPVRAASERKVRAALRQERLDEAPPQSTGVTKRSAPNASPARSAAEE